MVSFNASLYAQVKYIQWNWPQIHGEDKCIAMLNGLHIKIHGNVEHMTLFRGIKLDYCTYPGSNHILWHSRLLLKAAHLTRTRHAQQMSDLTLTKLQQDVFLCTVGQHDGNSKEA